MTIKNASMREELVNELGTLDQQLGWVSQVREAPRQQIKLINSKGALLNNPRAALLQLQHLPLECLPLTSHPHGWHR